MVGVKGALDGTPSRALLVRLPSPVSPTAAHASSNLSPEPAQPRYHGLSSDFPGQQFRACASGLRAAPAWPGDRVPAAWVALLGHQRLPPRHCLPFSVGYMPSTPGFRTCTGFLFHWSFPMESLAVTLKKSVSIFTDFRERERERERNID